MSLFAELKRRNVFRVGLAYLVTSWLVIQIADTVFPRIGLPDSSVTLVIALLALGLVPALVIAWAFELTPEGIKREIDVDRSQPVARHAGRKLDFAIIGILLAALAYFVWESRFATPQEEAPLLPDRVQMESESQAETVNSVKSEVNPTSRKSIAVLPFDTRSMEKSDEYFSAGIHDDLLTQLAKIEAIKVISRTSVMQYENTTKPIRQIAAELGAATIMEGGIQRAGDRVRINAQLIEAASDTHLWAETWDKELTASNIFEIQSELAWLIAEALQAELAPEVQQRIEDQPTESLEAYQLTLRGRYLMDKELSEENLESAASLFRRAIRLDAEYAGAWAGLSHALQELVGWHYRPEKEHWPEVRQAAEKAVELDPNLTEALLALGDIQRMERQYTTGEQTFLKAIDLSPGSADAHSRYSDLLRDASRFEESISEIRRAVELDPHLMRIRESLLQNIYFSRDYDTTLDEANALLELEPGAAAAWYWISLAQAQKGESAKAEEAMLKAIELDPGNPYYDIGLGYVYALGGYHEKVAGILDNSEQKGYSLVEISLVYGAMGELDLAFEYLDQALEKTPAALYYIASDPAADPMRADPRWEDFLARLGAL
jgi:TolB-like protein/Flp pilus assembly protein TadD